jgi:hypothetical protein
VTPWRPGRVSLSGVATATRPVPRRDTALGGQNLRWEINGSDGDLVLTSATGNLQVADLSLAGGRAGAASCHGEAPGLFIRERRDYHQSGVGGGAPSSHYDGAVVTVRGNPNAQGST